MNLQRRQPNRVNYKGKARTILQQTKQLCETLFRTQHIEIANFLTAIMLVLLASILYMHFEPMAYQGNVNTLRRFQTDFIHKLQPLHTLCKTYNLYSIFPRINSTIGYYSAGKAITASKNSKTNALLLLTGIYMSGFHSNTSALNPKLLGKLGDSIFDSNLLTSIAKLDGNKFASFERLLRSARAGKTMPPVSSQIAKQLRDTVYKPILSILAKTMQQGLIQLTPKGGQMISYMYQECAKSRRKATVVEKMNVQ